VKGVNFTEVIIDKTFAHENAPTRKPNTGLLQHFLGEGYDLKNSFVIGDRINDVVLAKNMGAKAIWLSNNLTLAPMRTWIK
jgi:imidazoleglycerol-phosphate dehydratase/histidinol-phosphatase